MITNRADAMKYIGEGFAWLILHTNVQSSFFDVAMATTETQVEAIAKAMRAEAIDRSCDKAVFDSWEEVDDPTRRYWLDRARTVLFLLHQDETAVWCEHQKPLVP